MDKSTAACSIKSMDDATTAVGRGKYKSIVGLLTSSTETDAAHREYSSIGFDFRLRNCQIEHYRTEAAPLASAGHSIGAATIMSGIII